MKNDLLEMTNSALCEHMLAQAIKLSAMEEGTGDGHGVPGWYALTRPRLQKFLANNPAVPLEPLQVLSILKLAKPTPLPDPAPSADEVAGSTVAAPPKGPARFVDVTEFIPLAAATIENMFDPKYLVSLSLIFWGERNVKTQEKNCELISLAISFLFKHAEKNSARNSDVSNVSLSFCLLHY